MTAGQASCTAGRSSFITGRIPIRTALSGVLAPGDPNGLTKQTPTIAEYLKQANYTTVQLGKWHLGDKPENFPTSHGFDEMYQMLPYYSGVYAYENLTLHPNFPANDPEFQKVWKGLANLSEYEGKAGQPPNVIKSDFNYDDLQTADDNMRAKAVEWIKAHAHDANPFFMYLCFTKTHNPNNPSPRWKGKSPGGGVYLDKDSWLGPERPLKLVRPQLHRRRGILRALDLRWRARRDAARRLGCKWPAARHPDRRPASQRPSRPQDSEMGGRRARL